MTKKLASITIGRNADANRVSLLLRPIDVVARA